MEKSRALRNIRVLELGEYISAAYCTRLLADYGAQVIKVEPLQGDLARRHGPYPDGEADPENSGLFIALNLGKLGVTLDVRNPSSADTLMDLVRSVDVVVENYNFEDAERWGLTPGAFLDANPTVVVTSITPFGRDGPYANYKSYAINTSAFAGAAHRIGRPDRYPLAMPYERADFWGGMSGAPATMLGLQARRRNGRGQHVDISTAECINTFGNGGDIIHFADSGTETARKGIRGHIAYPYTLLPCKDGTFGLILGYQRHWERFVELMGRPDWAKTARYSDRAMMGFAYPEEVDELVKPWLAQYTKEEIWAMLRERQIPYHPVQTVAEVLKWEQLQTRNYWASAQDGSGRVWTVPGVPFKMGKTPGTTEGRAPTLGEHNATIFRDLLALSGKELERLRRHKVIGGHF